MASQLVSALLLGKEKKKKKNLVCTVSVVLNISLYYTSQEWSGDMIDGVKKKSVRQKIKKSAILFSTNDSALG